VPVAALDETGFVGEHHGLRAVVEAELGEDARDMGLDGRVADDQLGSDLGVGQAAGQLSQDVDLARCQLRELGRRAFARRGAAGELGDEAPRDRRREKRAPVGESADRADEVLCRPVLEQEAAGSAASLRPSSETSTSTASCS
jgi:hypothetical protein